MQNPILPQPAKVLSVTSLTAIEKYFELQVLDEKFAETFDYRPGQFVEISIMGVGEAPISICDIRQKKGHINLTVRNVGRVTNGIHRLKEGDRVYLRGPYGNGFPMEKMKGSSLLLVAGGLGVCPLRSVLHYALKYRSDYKDLAVMYGVRGYPAMLFRDEFVKLITKGDECGCKFYLSYEDPQDKECMQLEAENSNRCTAGMVTKLFEKVEVDPKDTYVIICGPPVMYKFVTQELTKRGFAPEKIYMTLERRMKCGLGKCGHCICGDGSDIKFVCKDGPVFTYWDAQRTKNMI